MSAPAVQIEHEALNWVRAGYGDALWPETSDAWRSQLFRLGAWWKRRGAEPPVFVDEISDRVVLINRHVLVVDPCGGVISCFEFAAAPQARVDSALN